MNEGYIRKQKPKYIEKFTATIHRQGHKGNFIVKARDGRIVILVHAHGVKIGDTVEVGLLRHEGTYYWGEVLNRKLPTAVMHMQVEGVMDKDRSISHNLLMQEAKQTEDIVKNKNEARLEKVTSVLASNFFAKKALGFMLSSTDFVPSSEIKKLSAGTHKNIAYFDNLESTGIFQTFQRGKDLYYCFRGELRLGPKIEFVKNAELRKELSDLLNLLESLTVDNSISPNESSGAQVQ